jgi:hypothetical protein
VRGARSSGREHRGQIHEGTLGLHGRVPHDEPPRRRIEGRQGGGVPEKSAAAVHALIMAESALGRQR